MLECTEFSSTSSSSAAAAVTPPFISVAANATSNPDMMRPLVLAVPASSKKGSPLKPGSTPREVSKGTLYLSETFSLMLDRWEKVNKDFFSAKTGLYDLSKVPDVYDMIRFDVLHNSHLNLDGMDELFQLAMAFENSVVPQEYGKDSVEKRVIGSKVCGALLEKIKYDLNVAQSDKLTDMRFHLDHSHSEDLDINSLGRAVRTRLYFTSESHLHTLLNVLRYPGPGEDCAISAEGLSMLDEVNELSYLTQIVLRLFVDRLDPRKFR